MKLQKEKINLLLIKIFFLIAFPMAFPVNSFSALVTGNTCSQNVQFGSLDPGTGGGTIKSSGTVSGTVKSFGGYQNGSCTVTGTGVGGAFNNTVRIFLTNNSTTLSSGGNSMNAIFSLSSSGTSTQQDYTLSSGTVAIPIYGTLTLNISQASGSYSGSYSFIACSCSFLGCPTSTTDVLCL